MGQEVKREALAKTGLDKVDDLPKEYLNKLLPLGIDSAEALYGLIDAYKDKDKNVVTEFLGITAEQIGELKSKLFQAMSEESRQFFSNYTPREYPLGLPDEV